MAITNYHWGFDDCVMHETDETGATTVTYTHEPGPFGPLISENRGGTTYYHHDDALGSTIALTNDAGTVTDTFFYDAWGSKQPWSTGTTPTPYTWCGRWGYQDDTATTGRYYVRERDYGPVVARWMSVDPLFNRTRSSDLRSALLVLGLHVYRKPIIGIDPTGLFCLDPDAIMFCGPTVDKWFAEMLGKVHAKAREMTLGTEPQKTFWKTLKFELADLVSVNCPRSEQCKSTVTLCGRCINVTELGNIALGYAAGESRRPASGQGWGAWALGIDSDAVAMFGGFLAERLNQRGFSSLEEVRSALAGIMLRRQWKNSKNICDVLSAASLKKIPRTAIDELIDGIGWINQGKQNLDLEWWNENTASTAGGRWDRLIRTAFNQLAQKGYLASVEEIDCLPCLEVPRNPKNLTVKDDGNVEWTS